MEKMITKNIRNIALLGHGGGGKTSLAEAMLYMAFVALSNYTQPSYELGYALKFFRMITVILTGLFGLSGLIIGTLLFIIALLTNQTLDGRRRYLYPLIPFNWKVLKYQLLRLRRDEDS